MGNEVGQAVPRARRGGKEQQKKPRGGYAVSSKRSKYPILPEPRIVETGRGNRRMVVEGVSPGGMNNHEFHCSLIREILNDDEPPADLDNFPIKTLAWWRLFKADWLRWDSIRTPESSNPIRSAVSLSV